MEDQSAIVFQTILSFKVGKELFAAEVEKVLSILDLVNITRVPQSPEYMLGIINLRGSVLPVIDSRVRFGIQTSDNTRNTCIIVMEVQFDKETINIGVLVDDVREVIEINTSGIMLPPSLGSKYKADFIKGIISHSGDFIMLLDIDKLFSSDELLLVKDVSVEQVNDNNTSKLLGRNTI
jgi:purine-binding chemotaxis protein CheW